MKKRVSLLLLGVLLLGLLAGQSVAAKETSRVTPGDALKVARRFLQEHQIAGQPEWQGATVAEPVAYQTPGGQPDSYVLTVRDGSDTLGFIVVGATREHAPILEHGTGVAPHDRLDAAREKAESMGYSPSKLRLIHGGPTVFLAEFGDGPDDEPLLINLLNLGVADARWSAEPEAMPAQAKVKHGKQWTTLLSDSPSGDVTTQAYIEQTVANFPTGFDMDNTDNPNSGCGAVAGAAIHWFYAEHHGYEDLRTSVGSYDWADMANHLYGDMESAFYGTSATKFADGMLTHANTHAGYSFTTQAVDSTTSPDHWTTFKSEINNGRPAGVYIGLSSIRSDPFEYHIMAAYGYAEEIPLGYREVRVATGWGYASSFNYDYYRGRYSFYFMWVRPG